MAPAGGLVKEQRCRSEKPTADLRHDSLADASRILESYHRRENEHGSQRYRGGLNSDDIALAHAKR